MHNSERFVRRYWTSYGLVINMSLWLEYNSGMPIFRFFRYFWPDPSTYFIFLFLNFLSLFVFIFCETARTRRFQLFSQKSSGIPDNYSLTVWPHELHIRGGNSDSHHQHSFSKWQAFSLPSCRFRKISWEACSQTGGYLISSTPSHRFMFCV